MTDYANPFGAPVPMGPPPAGASAGIGNPFDPFAAPAASPSASAPASAASPYQQQPPQPQYGGLPQTPQSQAHSQQPQAYQQYPGQMYGAPAQAPPVPPVSPTGAYQHQQMPQMQHQQQPTQQMVLASQQSNPYAAMVSPQWGATAPANAPATAVAGNPFDPFAPAPPAPAPAPVPQMEPAYQAALAPQAYPQDPFGGGPVAVAVAPPSQQPLQEFGSYAPAAPEPPVPSAVTYQEPDYSSAAHQMVAAHPPRQQEYSNYAMEAPSSPYTSGMGGAGGPPAYDPDSNGPDGDYDGNADNRQIVPAPSSSVVVHSPDQVRNQYSQAIAQYVQSESPGASPLPKAELVRKKGYVLSRISFRTIVMKKWKQSFWVQYGSHTMLWFRNEQDFDDWLNNPYHDQTQRNFLIKLAVNFVHDLYKPNVRGYQVTQCRTKPYGSKVVRQFKLERWMDYGPTIAAAFGSYDPKEVDACREAIVECMKNTPLDNGIRATGAIKEHHDRQQQLQQNQLQLENGENQHHDQHGRQQQNGGYDNGGGNDPRFSASQSVDGYGHRSAPPHQAVSSSQSLASTHDLLGDHAAFDDSASVPPAATTSVDLLGDFNALVPATNPNAGYPGAPAPSPYYQQPTPPQYGAPPTPEQVPSYMQAQQLGYPSQQQAPGYGQPPSYPPQDQQYQQQQEYYPSASTQAQYPMGHQPALGPYDAYSQQQQLQQPHGGGYPAAAYPQPTQF